MNTWLYLSPQGLQGKAEDWPCWSWESGAPAYQAPLAEQGRRLAGCAVQVLVPMELGSYFHTPPWRGWRRPDGQALGYGIEELLGEELDDLRLLPGSRDAQRRYPVWVVGRARYEAVLAMLHACGVRPAAVFADADLLAPGRPGGAWVAGRWLLGGSLPLRLALSEPDLAILRGRLPEDMHWHNLSDAAFDPRLLEQPPAVAVNWLGRAATWRAVPWRWIAGSAALLLLVGWVFLWVRIEYLQQRSARLHLANTQRFELMWPGIAAQGPQARLDALRRGAVPRPAGPSSELTRLSQALLAGGGVQARRIEWRRGEGWRLELLADGLADLERLTQRSVQGGLAVVLGSATQSGARVTAIMTWPGDEA